jgi:hypothetical protein
MNGYLKLFFVMLYILGVSFGLGKFILNPKVTRVIFSLSMTCFTGSVFLILSIISGDGKVFVVGVILFVMSFPTGFPLAYYFYPIMKAHAERYKNRTN